MKQQEKNEKQQKNYFVRIHKYICILRKKKVTKIHEEKKTKIFK